MLLLAESAHLCLFNPDKTHTEYMKDKQLYLRNESISIGFWLLVKTEDQKHSPLTS